jgi:Zn-dependent M28 family amino/carboxypeptidase
VPAPDLARLERDVRRLAVVRHPEADPDALHAAEDFVALELGATGLRVERQLFTWNDIEYHNVVATRDGSDPTRPWIVVGAHFDSTPATPGADDNASGVAAMLEIARLLETFEPAATVQFVGFNLEEIQRWVPPTYRVGSRAYVKWLTDQVARVDGAFVLEMVGYTGPRQRVPAAVNLVKRVPKTGHFLAAVGDGNSHHLLAAMERAAEGVLELVTLGVPLKGFVVPDTRRSDNARFWDVDYPALMVTDTADLRNPNYHQATDTPETLDYAFMAKVVTVVARAVVDLAGSEAQEPETR